MNNPNRASLASPEKGAITIMVALMLLVLLTIAAIGMSRNSFREIVNSAFSRQGAMASNVADSGIEWSIYWIAEQNASGATGTAANLNTLSSNLLANKALRGVPKDINDPTGGTTYVPGSATLQSDLTLPVPSGAAAGSQGGVTLGLTNMGKLEPMNMSQGVGQGAFAPGSGNSSALDQAPNLWVIRADARVPQGSVTFTHAKEAWFTTPIQ